MLFSLRFEMSPSSHETHEVGSISARQSGELVIGLCHLDVAFDVWSGESVESVQLVELVEPVVVLELVHVVVIAWEQVFGGSERVETRASSISRVGAVRSIRVAKIIGRQRVSV